MMHREREPCHLCFEWFLLSERYYCPKAGGWRCFDCHQDVIRGIQSPGTLTQAAAIARHRAKKKECFLGDKQAQREVADFYWQVAHLERMACDWCGENTWRDERCVDHVIPLVRGGPHIISNLCCSCISCNQKKGSKMPDEFMVQAAWH